MSDKILSLGQLTEIAVQARKRGKKIVATNGCFDLLHVGHVRYLHAARAFGDALVVGINGDASVRSLKGDGRPLNNERDRAEVLAALECVDYVTLFPELRATNFLRAALPSVYVKGGDYEPDTLDAEERATLEQIGATIRIVDFEAGYSTTAILQRIAGR